MSAANLDLDGAIDLHVHTAPDVYERSVDDDEAIRQAQASRMRAVLLKSHHTPTADRATLVSKRFGVPVFGGLVLNHTVGGLNPVAVETAIAFGARQIWMPTLHSRHCLETAEAEMFRAEARKGREGLSVLDADGRPTKQVSTILEQIRDADIALGTGHLAPEESLVLLRAAVDIGVRRLLVTHPLMSFTRFSRDQMRTATGLGAKLEFCYLSCCPTWHDPVSLSETAAAIRHVGVQHCVLSTDGGQASNPVPVDMLRQFAQGLADEGFSRDELRMMMCENPAWMLDV